MYLEITENKPQVMASKTCGERIPNKLTALRYKQCELDEDNQVLFISEHTQGMSTRRGRGGYISVPKLLLDGGPRYTSIMDNALLKWYLKSQYTRNDMSLTLRQLTQEYLED